MQPGFLYTCHCLYTSIPPSISDVDKLSNTQLDSSSSFVLLARPPVPIDIV